MWHCVRQCKTDQNEESLQDFYSILGKKGLCKTVLYFNKTDHKEESLQDLKISLGKKGQCARLTIRWTTCKTYMLTILNKKGPCKTGL